MAIPSPDSRAAGWDRLPSRAREDGIVILKGCSLENLLSQRAVKIAGREVVSSNFAHMSGAIILSQAKDPCITNHLHRSFVAWRPLRMTASPTQDMTQTNGTALASCGKN